MPDSKAVLTLRANRVYNPWGFYLNGRIPFINRTGPSPAQPPCWAVIKGDERLSDAWYDHGAKTFCYGLAQEKQQALEAAIRWASERFNVEEWARDPFGAYGPADFITKRLAEFGLRPPRVRLEAAVARLEERHAE